MRHDGLDQSAQSTAATNRQLEPSRASALLSDIVARGTLHSDTHDYVYERKV